ncbi:MAG: cytochrome C oxidase subunit IV family protein [Deltaproteobacteria bacterium]|nr:cytochrome C oxidase subunit IV family protein [Deltaproteobacteria bacterium]
MNRGTYIKIYFVLLAMVGVSVLLGLAGHTRIAVAGIFATALFKASLVLGYYMHLKAEKNWVKWMLGSGVACLVILFVGLVPDIVYVYGRIAGN